MTVSSGYIIVRMHIGLTSRASDNYRLHRELSREPYARWLADIYICVLQNNKIRREYFNKMKYSTSNKKKVKFHQKGVEEALWGSRSIQHLEDTIKAAPITVETNKSPLHQKLLRLTEGEVDQRTYMRSLKDKHILCPSRTKAKPWRFDTGSTKEKKQQSNTGKHLDSGEGCEELTQEQA